VYADGCECCDDANGKACGNAQGLGTLAVNASASVTATGKLPNNAEADWFAVTFTGNTSLTYHPKITISGDTGVVFEVLAGCSATGPMSCTDGTAGGVTTWEEFYSAGDPNSAFIPISPVGNSGTVYIKVYRANGTATCNQFTITVTNT
jgi:hypothetical protein